MIWSCILIIWMRVACSTGTLQATQPTEPPQVEAAKEEAMITRDQMRTADRIIVNVLQKVLSD